MIKLYSAAWCTNCTPIKLMLKDIEHEVIDIDKDPEAARSQGIRGIPTLINEAGERLVGAVTPQQFKDFLR